MSAAVDKAHALLSASGSHKWLHCTPSARLEENMPEAESDYANEGRLAHEIGELKLIKFTSPMGARTYNSKLKKLQEKPLYQPEMLGHIDTYLNYISGVAHEFKIRPYMAVEKKLDYSTYVPEGFGTGDCIIIGGGTLHIIDLKYGKGVPVYAVNNPQMLLYALGAYSEYSFLYQIESVKMVIVQPRLDNISEYVLPLSELLAWGESIKPVAQIAFEGKGEFVSGEHCRFCRAKALCRARSEFNMSVEEYHYMKPPLITNDEVGQLLAKTQNLVAWVKALEDYALAECLKGIAVPGWKAVHGRGDRKFIDQDAAFETLKTKGIQEEMLYERKPLSLAKVEELVGKATFKTLMDGQITKPAGKPTLVPISDNREEIKRQNAEEDFKVENQQEEIPEGLIRDLKAYYGIPPYDSTFTNFVRGDVSFITRVEGNYSRDQIEKAKAIIGIYPGNDSDDLPF